MAIINSAAFFHKRLRDAAPLAVPARSFAIALLRNLVILLVLGLALSPFFTFQAGLSIAIVLYTYYMTIYTTFLAADEITGASGYVWLFATPSMSLKMFLLEWVAEIRDLASESVYHAVAPVLIPSLFFTVAFFVSPGQAIVLCIVTACMASFGTLFRGSSARVLLDDCECDQCRPSSSSSLLGTGFLNEWAAEVRVLTKGSLYLIPSLVLALAYAVSPSVAMISLLINIGISEMFGDDDRYCVEDNIALRELDSGSVDNDQFDNNDCADHLSREEDSHSSSHEDDGGTTEASDSTGFTFLDVNAQDGDCEHSSDGSSETVIIGNDFNLEDSTRHPCGCTNESDGVDDTIRSQSGSSAGEDKEVDCESRVPATFDLSSFITNDYMKAPSPILSIPRFDQGYRGEGEHLVREWTLLEEKRRGKWSRKAVLKKKLR